VCVLRPWICNCKHRDVVFEHGMLFMPLRPHLYASVIVMSETSDDLDVVERGRGGESGIFSNFSPFSVLIAWHKNDIETAQPTGAAVPPQQPGHLVTGAYLMLVGDIQ
jgi:hypothetical protein